MLSAIVALIEDTEEEVAFEAVRGLETVSFFQALSSNVIICCKCDVQDPLSQIILWGLDYG